MFTWCRCLPLPFHPHLLYFHVPLQKLSLTDYQMLQHDYPTIAAAALLAAHSLVGAELVPSALLLAAPFLVEADVFACARSLCLLHSNSQEAA